MPPGTLEGSDAYVKKAIADLAPAFSEWLMSSQQIRKWILTIDLMADGTLIKQDRPLSFPMERFEATPQDDTRFLMSSSNFTRTDLLINALVAIDVDHLVYYYQKWLPLLDKAYQELGKRGSFHGRVKKAIDQVTNAKPFAGEALLEKRGGVMYRYVDPTLESASDVEKLMWRLGPENSAKLQSYLKQVRAEMP